MREGINQILRRFSCVCFMSSALLPVAQFIVRLEVTELLQVYFYFLNKGHSICQSRLL